MAPAESPTEPSSASASSKPATGPELQLTIEMLAPPQCIAQDTEGKLHGWLDIAQRYVRTYVKLIVAPDSQDGITEALAGSVLKDMRGDIKGNVCTLYQIGCAGESSSHPHLRVPSFRGADHLRMYMAAWAALRGDADALQDGDLHLIADGGKRGLEQTFHSCFKKGSDNRAMEKNHHIIMLTYTEDSVAQRRVLNRGATTLDQCEILHVFSKCPIALEHKKRRHYSGSNYGNVMGPIALPKWDDLWMVDVQHKKDLLGKSGKILASNGLDKNLRELHTGDQSKPKFNDTMEPVNWHAIGTAPYEEFVHSFSAKAICHITCFDQDCALACLLNTTHYVGFTFSTAHRDLLYAKLAKDVFSAFNADGGPLCKPSLMELMQTTEASSSMTKVSPALKKRTAKDKADKGAHP